MVVCAPASQSSSISRNTAGIGAWAPPPPIGAVTAVGGLDVLLGDQRQQRQRELRVGVLAQVDLG